MVVRREGIQHFWLAIQNKFPAGGCYFEHNGSAPLRHVARSQFDLNLPPTHSHTAMSSSHVLRFSLLAVVLMALVLSGSASRIQQCRTRCSQMRQDAGVAQRRETLCRPYEGRLPRPIVYHACLQAFDAALQPACEVTCEYPELTCDNNIVSEPALKSALESRCTGMRSRRPTPLMYNVCEAGFRGGARAVCSVVAAQEKATAAKAVSDALVRARVLACSTQRAAAPASRV